MLEKKENYKILLLEGIHAAAQDNLKKAGFHVDLLVNSISEDELIKQAKEYDVIGIRSKTSLNKKIISNLPNLMSIGAFCIGTNQIDLETSNKLGIPVFNAPYSNTRSVAEMIIAEIIMLARKLGDQNINMHNTSWDKSAKGSVEIRGKVLGIVGYGHIGSQVSILAESLGMEICYYDIIKKLPLGNARPLSSLNEILKISDFVTLHVPETPLTINMINKDNLKIMKKNSYLLNASRGSVVNIKDLCFFLENKHLSGAAIDVFPSEPSKNNDVFNCELSKLNNVILTPHIGGSTQEAQEAIGLEVSDSIIKYLSEGMTLESVNFPSIAPKPLNGFHRILNIHKNVPGVLSEINKIISKTGVNIEGQYLATDSNIGYLVMDIEKNLSLKEISESIFIKIKNLSTSIKTRLIC